MQPQPQTVAVAPWRPHTVTQYAAAVNSQTIQITAILQLVAGVVVLGMQILYIALYGLLIAYASGWWSWILYVSAGGVGLAAANNGSVSMVKAYVGLSIGSALLAGGTFILWILGMIALSTIGWMGPIIMCVITMLAIAVELVGAIIAAVQCYKLMNSGVVHSQPMQQGMQQGVYPQYVQQGAYPQYVQQGVQQGAYPPQYVQPVVYPPTSAQQQGVGTNYLPAQQMAYPQAGQQTEYPPAVQQTENPPAYQQTVDTETKKDGTTN